MVRHLKNPVSQELKNKYRPSLIRTGSGVRRDHLEEEQVLITSETDRPQG